MRKLPEIFESGETVNGLHVDYLLPRSRKLANAADNCGTGSGGFAPGNTCAKGEGAGASATAGRATRPLTGDAAPKTARAGVFDAAAWTAKSVPDRIKEWGGMTQSERDNLADAANSVPARKAELLSPLGEAPESTGDLKADTAARLAQASEHVTPYAATRIQKHMDRYGDLMAEAGVKPELATKLAAHATDELLAQEMEGMRRQLGDHGIAHIGGNIDRALNILEVVPGVDTAQEKLQVVVSNIYHDSGYMTGPSRSFLDEGHPRWSAESYGANVKPMIVEALGQRAANEIAHDIRTHADTSINWQEDTVGSAVRVADNTGLFQRDKLPPLFRHVPANIETLSRMSRKEIDVPTAQAEMRANVAASRYPAAVKEALTQAAGEVSQMSGKFTLGMMGGNIEAVRWEGDHVAVDLREDKLLTELHKIGDFGQRQFGKFAETYGQDPEEFKSSLAFEFKDRRTGQTLLSSRMIKGAANALWLGISGTGWMANDEGENCGTGSGGFQEGNTCARGGGASSLGSAFRSKPRFSRIREQSDAAAALAAYRERLKTFADRPLTVARAVEVKPAAASVQDLFTPDPPPSQTMFAPAKVSIWEVPLNRIALSKDVPNFKTEADPETGVVSGNKLAGQYERVGTAPIVLWQRTNGDLEVITGRHRLDLARRMGEDTIPSQIMKESEGFTQHKALVFDAESNIRDGQGEIDDYAFYFKNSPELTLEKAESRGLLGRVKGRAGWDLGRSSTDDLYTAWENDRVNTEKAVAIARAAPGDANLQRLGLSQALKGKSAPEIENFIKAVQHEAKGSGATEMDMFGSSDAALNKAEEMASKAAKYQSSISDQIRAVNSAAKRPEAAAKLGVDVKDPASVLRRVKELRGELARWASWPQHPDLVAQVRANEGGQQCGLSFISPEKECRVGVASEKLALEKEQAKVVLKRLKQVASDKGWPADKVRVTARDVEKAVKGTGLDMHALKTGLLDVELQDLGDGTLHVHDRTGPEYRKAAFAMDAPESVADQQARKDREAAVALRVKQQEELAKRSKKRLVGGLGSAGQFDMFGAPAATTGELFAHERPGLSGFVWRVKRWLGNSGTPCGDSYIAPDKDCHKGAGEAAAPATGHGGGSLKAAVVHLSDSDGPETYAKAIFETASAADRTVTPDLEAAVKASGGELHGLKNRLKTEESLARKLPAKAEQKNITVKEYAGKLGDALRYTAVLPVSDYTGGVLRVKAALETKGYQFTDKEQKWANDDYKALHYNMVTPGGLTTELQFHTPESIATKGPSHKIFEELRVTKDPKVKLSCLQKLHDLWAKVRVPDRVFSI